MFNLNPSTKRVGLLGGSFDPIHRAHIQLACAARDQQQLDRIDLIPAFQPWQRTKTQANAKQRLEMTRLAASQELKISVNPLEIERAGLTYTIDTINALEPGCHYYWILGADQLSNFCTWRDWQEIAQRLTLLVAQRPHTPLVIPSLLQERIHLGKANVELLNFEPLNISSSDIRHRLARQQPVDHLVDKLVLQYIKEHNLYSSTPETSD